MSVVKFSRSAVTRNRPDWPVWASRIALLLSALISLLTGIAQARANVHANGTEHSRMMAAVLAVHNQVRAAANVPPVEWSDALAARAARWADHLARIGYMTHSDTDMAEGENLWMGSAGAFSYDLMVRDWADEARFFRIGHFPDISSTGDWQDAGHYAQMVARNTRRIGCAVASGDGWDYLVCRYDTPGNVFGQRPY